LYFNIQHIRNVEIQDLTPTNRHTIVQVLVYTPALSDRVSD